MFPESLNKVIIENIKNVLSELGDHEIALI